MKKIGFLCSYKEGSGDGQSIKSLAFIKYFNKVYGEENVQVLNGSSLKNINVFLLPFKIFRLVSCCDNLILNFSFKGTYITLLFVVFFNKIFHKKVFLIPAGGGGEKRFKKHPLFHYFHTKVDCVFLETEGMVNAYKATGVLNVAYLPNFREHEAVDKSLLKGIGMPVKLCTFSRVSKAKGIEEAVKAVDLLNQNEVRFKLDIYGQVDPDYQDDFANLVEGFSGEIEYKGLIKDRAPMSVLAGYDVLLFPTFWSGEGAAGTILDAFASGLPVVASDWKYNEEIVQEGVTGTIFPVHNVQMLAEAIGRVTADSESLYEMKVNCLKEFEKYLPQNALASLLGKFD